MIATAESLKDQVINKLVGREELTRSRGGRFLFPTSLVEEYYQQTGVDSWFRGAYLRSDAEIQIAANVPKELKAPWPFNDRVLKNIPGSVDIAVYLTPVNQVGSWAHWLQLKEGREPELVSLKTQGLLAQTTKRIPTEQDYNFFSRFIAASDSRNLWAPSSWFLSRPQPKTN